MKKLFLFLLVIAGIQSLAQVKIGSAGSPNGNAVLELDGGTTKGLLLPRITNTDMIGAGFSSSPNGLLIYNSTDGFVYIRKGSAWQKITDATNNTSFTLPYSGVVTQAVGNIFSVFNNAGNAGYSSISGQTLGAGNGISGFSTNGTGVQGSSTNGDAAYFQSTNGYALRTGKGHVAINNPANDWGSLQVNGDSAFSGYFTSNFLSGNTKVLYAEYTGGTADATGVYGKSRAADYYGYGGIFEGGYTGVKGFVTPTGSNNYAGGRFTVNGGSGTNYAVYASATNSGATGISYGVYAVASAGTNSAAGYFEGTGTNFGILVPSGNVGVGTLTPTLARIQTRGLVGANAALFGDNTTGVSIQNGYPGVGFNTYYNAGSKSIVTGFGSLTGQDPTTGRYYISTTSASVTGSGTAMNLIDRFSIKADGNIGVEGNTDPKAPLSFASNIGNKIALWGDASTPHYGLGIQGALMQLYTNTSAADIALGFGSSGGFTEKYRLGNNGLMNIQNGRLRFTGQVTPGTAHGIEFTNNAGSAVRSFIGMYDDNNMGFYGFAGAGWGLIWDATDGALKIGTTQKATGYKLNVGGKIIAEEVRVTLQASWPDYVFAKDYSLPSLQNLEQYIAANNHLPNVPAAAEIEKSGIGLGAMQTKMMEKIEELTLYILQLKKENQQMQSTIADLKAKVDARY